MTRPMYESSADRDNERKVADRLSSIWKCTAKKLPTAYYIDWAMMRNDRIAALIEVKCRKNSSGKYPTLMLSLAKWLHGLQFSELLGVPFLVAVQWEDGLFYHRAGTATVEFGFGGRADRNDSQDMEPVVFIPVSEFRCVG